MASPICVERSDLPTPKRLKFEGNTCDDYESEENLQFYKYDSEEERSDRPSPKRHSEDATPEEIQQFDDEWNKSQGYEIDFSKLTYWFGYQPVDLDDSTMVDEPETDGDLIAFMAKAALAKRNAEWGTSLELGKVLMAHGHLGGGIIFYISFEVNDPSASDGNQTIPFRAMVGFLGKDSLTIYSCDPKPSP